MKVLAILMALGLVAPAFAQKAAIPQQTVDNLNAAIQGEANASHRYAVFARKADAEGYTQVAKLFRAASLSESIHRKNHEHVLREAGIQPKEPRMEEVQVGTTRENLEVPVRGEQNESDEMYPAFIKQARSADVPAAERSFQYALTTEKQHLALFKRALARLGNNPPEDYYVGRVSGETTTTPSEREPYTVVR